MMVAVSVLLRLVASFMAGLVIVALVTTLADLLGEGPAGFVGGLPLTGPISILAIGATQSSSAAIQAVALFPLGFSVTFAFLLFYAAPKTLGFSARMPLALGLWFVTAACVALLAPGDFAVSVGSGGVIALAVLLVRSRISTSSGTRIETRPTRRGVLLRGALGGVVVVAVEVLSAASGPLVGGVFAAAPAIWSSSLYVTYRAQGLQFSRSLTWPFMQTGILTAIPYAVAAYFLFSALGIWVGTALAYVSISPLGYLAWRTAGRGRALAGALSDSSGKSQTP